MRSAKAVLFFLIGISAISLMGAEPHATESRRESSRPTLTDSELKLEELIKAVYELHYQIVQYEEGHTLQNLLTTANFSPPRKPRTFELSGVRPMLESILKQYSSHSGLLKKEASRFPKPWKKSKKGLEISFNKSASPEELQKILTLLGYIQGILNVEIKHDLIASKGESVSISEGDSLTMIPIANQKAVKVRFIGSARPSEKTILDFVPHDLVELLNGLKEQFTYSPDDAI